MLEPEPEVAMEMEMENSKVIKEILDEIPRCQANEFQNEGGCDCEVQTEADSCGLTEPNDSPFRVRRLSRSFSIPNGVKLEDKFLAKEELLVGSSNDENCQDQAATSETSSVKSKFILLKRSRSLGNIFVLNSTTAVPAAAGTPSVDNLTEKVEALEIEVLPGLPDKEKKAAAAPLIDRPQTSPPVLLAAAAAAPSASNEGGGGKPSILDRMQKSLGFIFRCARKEEAEEEDDARISSSRTSTNNSSRCSSNNSGSVKYPLRSRTPDPKFIRKQTPVTVIKHETTTPMQSVNVNNFITKVDSEPPKMGKMPQFFDVSGPKGPLLRPQSDLNLDRKCLVLDLDETLVHSSFHVPESHDLVVSLGLTDGSHQHIYVAKRPGVDEFLARVSKQFEVVIFTASLAHYADPVIDFLARGMNEHLDEARGIDLRLYRESCLFLRGLYVKDLSRLGRKLDQTVIVDNSPASFLLQPEHGIPIKSWFSDPSDRELAILQESLLHLVAAENVSDWRLKLSSV